MNAFRRLQLSHQVALITLLASLLASVALIAMTQWMSSRMALSQTERQLNQTMAAIAVTLQSSFDGARSSAAQNMKTYQYMLGATPTLSGISAADGLPQLVAAGRVLNGNQQFLEQVKQVTGVDPGVMVVQDGKFVRVATLLKDKNGQLQNGVALDAAGPETQALVAGESYFGVVNRNGKFYMSLFEPLKGEDGKVIGAISVRASLDEMLAKMKESIASIKIGDSGYAYVMVPGKQAQDIVMLIHPSLGGKRVGDLGNAQLTRVVGDLVGLKNGIHYYDWLDGKSQRQGQKVAAVATIPGPGWVVGAGSWTDEFTAPAISMRNSMVVAALAGALVTVLLVVWVVGRGLRPVAQLVDAVGRMGAGDLSRPFPFRLDSHNELDRLGASLEQMRQGMGEVIRRIRDSSLALNAAAREMESDAGKVFDGSYSQSESASALAAAVEQLTVSITQVAQGADSAEMLSRSARAGAHAGQTHSLEVTQEIVAVEGEIAQTAKVVGQLGHRTSEISRVAELIKDIAEQTNLLALNAAIEAARAGESGRGFAVVADEVRKLAERTTVSAGEIGSAIGAVQSESTQVVERIDQLAGRMQQVVDAVGQAGQALTEIEQQSDQALGAVTAIAASTREQAAASQNIAGGVEGMAQLSEQTRRISESSRNAASRLGGLAGDLDAMVARFTLA